RSQHALRQSLDGDFRSQPAHGRSRKVFSDRRTLTIVFRKGISDRSKVAIVLWKVILNSRTLTIVFSKIISDRRRPTIVFWKVFFDRRTLTIVLWKVISDRRRRTVDRSSLPTPTAS